MPFKLFYLPSYERCLKRLGERERQMAGFIVTALHHYFQTGSLASGKPFVVELEGRSRRLVFKKLQGALWEAYLEGKVRILTRLEKDTHYLVFAGNHDQVQQFLKDS